MKLDASVENLIFDLGGVIVDLSVDHTVQAFSAISGMDKQKVNDLYYSAPGFEAYEKGLMNDEDFRNYIREVFGFNASAAEIDTCWNAILRGVAVSKLQLLLKLKDGFNVYLLSNTNNIHIHHLNQAMLPDITQTTLSIEDYFHHAYYSHVMKKRKPDAEIFRQVLDENNLVPGKTLFLDDNMGNIEGANLVGIKTVHVNTPNFILDYFHDH